MRPRVALLVVGLLVLAACGSDDGADVRKIGGEDSPTATGSASASATGSASASGSAVACVPVGDPGAAAVTVEVELDEWSITPSVTSVEAGSVHFAVDNVGERPHELVIVEAESVADLPVDADGALEEERLPDGALVGEIHAFPAGEACDGVFDLEPGDYVLLCNLVEISDGEVESHLALGQSSTFTAE